MPSEEFVAIAGVQSPRGLRGEFFAYPLTEEPEYYLDLSVVQLSKGSKEQSFEIRQLRIHKDRYLVQLIGIDTIEDAAKWKGASLCVHEDLLRPLDEGEFFIHEFVGSDVFDTNNRHLGKVFHYFEAGGGGVAEVKSEAGNFLFPATKPVLVEFDRDQRKIFIEPPPGLIDLNRKDQASE